MKEKTVSNNSIKTLQWGMHDAVIGGEFVRDIPDNMIYVDSESQLSSLPAVPVGTIASLYGFTHMWHKKSDGTWEPIV